MKLFSFSRILALNDGLGLAIGRCEMAKTMKPPCNLKF